MCGADGLFAALDPAIELSLSGTARRRGGCGRTFRGQDVNRARHRRSAIHARGARDATSRCVPVRLGADLEGCRARRALVRPAEREQLHGSVIGSGVEGPKSLLDLDPVLCAAAEGCYDAGRGRDGWTRIVRIGTRPRVARRQLLSRCASGRRLDRSPGRFRDGHCGGR